MSNAQGLANVEAEIQRVKAEIEKLQKRLSDLDALQILLTQYIDVVGVGLVPIRNVTANVRNDLERIVNAPTKQAAIIEGSKKILEDGKRRFARELLVELANMGVEVGGKNPKSNLASYLSHSDEFQADTKAGGWTLAKFVSPKAKAGSADTRPALSTNGASRSPTYVARSSP